MNYVSALFQTYFHLWFVFTHDLTHGQFYWFELSFHFPISETIPRLKNPLIDGLILMAYQVVMTYIMPRG